jgi:hypothetical protein
MAVTALVVAMSRIFSFAVWMGVVLVIHFILRIYLF